MKLWTWLVGLLRHRLSTSQDPPDAAERFRRDAEAAAAVRAVETGQTSRPPPAG